MVATKKPTAVKTVKPKAPPKPKPFEVGYKFLVEAEIINIYPNQEWPYEVAVILTDKFSNSERACLNYDKEELVAFISKTNPKFKKDYITQQLKDAKALVASLEKQLAAD